MLAQVVKNASARLTASQHDYLYDAYGNRRQHMETINGSLITYNYTYDDLDRLLTAKNGSDAQDLGYGYDALDNLTRKVVGTPPSAATAHVLDPANQLLQAHAGSRTGTLLAPATSTTPMAT